MSAIFPHRAVTERYLHTGGSGNSSRKAVLAAFLGGVACAVLVANLPAGTLTLGATPAATAARAACQDRGWPYTGCSDAVAATNAEKTPTRSVSTDRSAAAAPPVQTAALEAKSTTGVGQGSTQPNSRPQAEPVAETPASNSVVARTPALQPAPAAAPVAAVAPAPASVAAVVPVPTVAPAPPTVAPTPPTAAPAPVSAPIVPDPAAAPPPPATRNAAAPPRVAAEEDDDDAARVSTRKAAHKSSLRQQRRAEQRQRTARRQETRTRMASAAPLAEAPAAAPPSYVRIIDLPNGQRVYQRLGSNPNAYGHNRRSFFGFAGNDYD